jgi:hypothetical protein
MTDAVAALANMRAIVGRGDTFRNGGNFKDAVADYKEAGQLGASVVGPAIDQLSGGAQQTASLTQQGWQRNGLLAALNSSDSATAADALAANNFVQQMLTWYQAAIGYAQKSKLGAVEHVAPTTGFVSVPAKKSGPIPAAPPSLVMLAQPPHVTTTAYVPVAPPAPALPQMPLTPLVLQTLPMMTVVPVMGGGLLGLVFGRLAGVAAGGPIGLVIGLAIGFGISRLTQPGVLAKKVAF